MALKDLVFTHPSKREIEAVILALDALDMEANRNIDNLTRVVAETALKTAAIERSSIRYKRKNKRKK